MSKKYLICLIALILTSIMSYALPSKVYLNESTEFSGPNSITLPLSTNLTIDDNLNHTFEGKSTGSNADWDVDYLASNATGFLLRLRIDDEVSTNDVIQSVDCVNTGALTTICDNGCGGNDLTQFHNYTVLFNATSLTAKIFIDGISRAETKICTNATQIGNVKFIRNVSTGFTVKNNFFVANNKNPNLVSSIPNQTWQEDSSTSFNISGNFTDANNDTLTYSILSNVENLTIKINSSTGLVNLSPTSNFFGIRYVIFLANDSNNITLSNNVTLNVTNVNDAPGLSDITLNNTDFLNRTNGSLIVSWIFSDPDNDLQQGNETLWYINGIEKLEFGNLTIIISANTTKNQNWTVSVRAFDGINFSNFVNSPSVIIQNFAPTHTVPLITSNDEHNRKNGTLTCNNQSTNDLDKDLITNFIRWYKNNVLADAAINSTTLNQGNYSKNDSIICEITPDDGALNGTILNSTSFTVLNAAPLLNNPIQNKTWQEDSSTTINLGNSFVDIDNDNLTYNFTSASNIAISTDNNTGIATLTPDTNFNGVRYILFFAYDKENLTSSNNVTLTINDAPEPEQSQSSPSSNTGSGSGGGGILSGKYICELNWECEDWSKCEDGKQARKCKLVKVPVFLLQEKCPQHKMPEQSKECITPIKKESCSDGIKNQDETGIDCGGNCASCPTQIVENRKDETKESNLPITGQVITELPNTNNAFLVTSVVLLAMSILFYAKISHKRIFNKIE